MPPELIDTQTGKKQAICVDCGDPFAHSPREIAARRGTGMPVSPRCPACRTRRLDEHNARDLEMLRNGDLRAALAKTPGPSEQAERLYAAICMGCQRPIRLPFKPRLDRPVFCRFCFDVRNGR